MRGGLCPAYSNFFSFVLGGVDDLMEKLLVSNARYIRVANEPGIRKIFRNILALRQNLRTLSSIRHDSEFKLAKRFFGLFTVGPEVCILAVWLRPALIDLI